MDLRKTLYGNIMLSGGSTLFKGTLLCTLWEIVGFFFCHSVESFLNSVPVGSNLLLLLAGFGDRLLSEVKKLAPKDIKIRVRLSCISLISACAKRKY